MRNLTKEWKHRKICYDLLISNGFTNNNGTYLLKEDILDGLFQVVIEISKDKMISRVIETNVNEEYILVDVEDATGEYVGKVKDAYQEVLNKCMKTCTVIDVFKEKQTKKLISYVEKTYGDSLEYLWEKFPDNAIWRNKKNNKWYAAILTVKKNKIDGIGEEIIEVLDLRYKKEDIDKMVDFKDVFPGYHMNKKSWITIKLDGSVDFNKICMLLDLSYELSLGNKK